jgi:hypothetical protein
VAVAGVITVGHGHDDDQDHDDDDDHHHRMLRLGAWHAHEKACLSELVRSFVSLVAGLGVIYFPGTTPVGDVRSSTM